MAQQRIEIIVNATVTAEAIRKLKAGKKRRETYCPVALAVAAALKTTKIYVCCETLHIGNKRFELVKPVRQFIALFDRAYPSATVWNNKKCKYRATLRVVEPHRARFLKCLPFKFTLRIPE